MQQRCSTSDATVLPGFIDAHVHLSLAGTPAANALASLNAGFTTVVDLGATNDAVLRLRDSINNGLARGPRILAAGLWAGVKNGICEFGGIGVEPNTSAFRARIRQNVANGADVIKLCVSGWPRAAFAEPEAYELADSVIVASVDEAKRANHLVVAHDISIGGVKAALRAGVDGLAHAAYVDSATAIALKTKGVFIVPTLASLVPPAAVGPPANALRAATGLAYRSGVRLVFGTDAGVIAHGTNAREFSAMVAVGIAHLDAIRAATINAATSLRLGDSVGTIAVGKIADLVAVRGDPLQDVTVLESVVWVMRAGREVRREESGR